MAARIVLLGIFALIPVMCMAQQDSVLWYDRVHELDEVTVDKKREPYSRKDNPAVELMRRVIEHKRLTDPTKKDYCT